MRIRTIWKTSVTLFAICLVVIPYFSVRVGTHYAYLGWTGEGPPYTGVGLRVAVVKPVFTATAYSGRLGGSPSFYEFYDKHIDDPLTQNITTDLNLLNVSVVDGWGWSRGLGRYITSVVGDYGLGIIVAQSFTVLSDIEVTEGSLFNPDGTVAFKTMPTR